MPKKNLRTIIQQISNFNYSPIYRGSGQHELGHAHLLRHINDETDLMYWELLPNTSNINSQDRKIFFSSSNLDGARDILDESVQTSFSYCTIQNQKHVPLHLSDCQTSMQINRFEIPNNSEISLYPNPTSDLVTLEFELSQNSIMKLSVLDQLGREVINQSEIKCHIGVNVIPLNISKLRSGIYMVHVLNDESQIVSKLIVR